MRAMSKSAVRDAREALAVGRRARPAYGSPFAKHTYTQPQLFALLVLKQFLNTDYRGLVTLVAEWTELRRALRRRFPRAEYHQRWHVESGFNQHKRRLGSALTARRTPAQRRELVLRVLAHNLMILQSRQSRISTEQHRGRT